MTFFKERKKRRKSHLLRELQKIATKKGEKKKERENIK